METQKDSKEKIHTIDELIKAPLLSSVATRVPDKINIMFSLCLGTIAIVLVGLVNYQIIWGWFGKSGPANIGSIEVSYVSMGRFLSDFGFPIGGSSWVPFWYFGFPSHVFYTPLLPFLEFLIHKTFGMDFWQAYRLLTGSAFILAPISVLFLGWYMSKRLIGGLISAVFYTVAPTIFYVLVPGVAADKISPFFWEPRRFTILVRWGEGPHLFSLIFLPLVGLFYARFLDQKKGSDFILTALFLGLTALTNAIGLFSAILLIGCLSFVKSAQSDNAKIKNLFFAPLTIVFTLLMVSFWYNLDFLSTFFREGNRSSSFFISLFPWGWVGAMVIVILVYILISKVIKNFAIASYLLWFGIFFLVVGIYYYTTSDGTWSAIEILPQALRYNAEVDLSLSILIGIIFSYGIGFLGKRHRIFYSLGNSLGILTIIAAIWYIQPFVQAAEKSSSSFVKLEVTSEKRIADWLGDHVNQSIGERVFVPGNYGFYLNWFTNIWQLRGGLFQASTHPWPDHIYYQLANGIDEEITKAWLTASNIKYMVINTPASQEIYHDIKNQERFRYLDVLYNENGDMILEVPLTRPSPAKPVSIGGLKFLHPPVQADDKQNLVKYSDWVENSSSNNLEFQVINNDTYHIVGNIGEKEAILVQMTADLGWQAYDKVNKRDILLGKDTLGFLMLYPQSGAVDISLKHATSWKEWLGYLITFCTVIFIIFQGFIPKQHRIRLTSKLHAR